LLVRRWVCLYTTLNSQLKISFSLEFCNRKNWNAWDELKLPETDPWFISSSIPDSRGPHFSAWAPRLWPNPERSDLFATTPAQLL
jgi:hypothetical protein